MQATIERIVTPAEASFFLKERDDPSFEFCWHFHPEYELTLIRHSRGRRLVGDSIADYCDGDLVLLGPYLPHTWFSDPADPHRGRHSAIVVQFLPAFLGDGFFDHPELQAVARLLKLSARGLKFEGPARERASRRLRAMPNLRGLDRLLGLLSTLDDLARSGEWITLVSPGFSPDLDQDNRRRVDAVFNYINQNYAGTISQGEAARIAHLSPSAFSRFFKRTTGRSFPKYINELRIGRACRLLIESDLSITQIGFASGFSNLANFNRRFLAQKQLSPRAYRRQFGGR